MDSLSAISLIRARIANTLLLGLCLAAAVLLYAVTQVVGAGREFDSTVSVSASPTARADERSDDTTSQGTIGGRMGARMAEPSRSIFRVTGVALQSPEPSSSPETPSQIPELVGVATMGSSRVALVRFAKSSRLRKITTDERIGGWKVEEIQDRAVILLRNGEQTTIKLPKTSGR